MPPLLLLTHLSGQGHYNHGRSLHNHHHHTRQLLTSASYHAAMRLHVPLMRGASGLRNHPRKWAGTCLTQHACLAGAGYEAFFSWDKSEMDFHGNSACVSTPPQHPCLGEWEASGKCMSNFTQPTLFTDNIQTDFSRV